MSQSAGPLFPSSRKCQRLLWPSEKKAMREIENSGPRESSKASSVIWGFISFKVPFPYGNIDPFEKWVALGVLANANSHVAITPFRGSTVPSSRKRPLHPLGLTSRPSPRPWPPLLCLLFLYSRPFPPYHILCKAFESGVFHLVSCIEDVFRQLCVHSLFGFLVPLCGRTTGCLKGPWVLNGYLPTPKPNL